MMDIDIDEDNAMEVDPDNPPSPAAIGELPSFLIPESLGLPLHIWNADQLGQYIIHVLRQIAEEFFTTYLSSINQVKML